MNILNLKKHSFDVVDMTRDLAIAYKPNFAFFERYGVKGYAILEKIIEFINGRALVIADAKRGDIGNTSSKYAESILDHMGFDAITISPYMGNDSIEPFINNIEKGVFILAMTSNESALELQDNNKGQKQLSKEFVREWLIENGFQGKEGQKIPEMNNEIINSISDRYIELYESIIGDKFIKRDTKNMLSDIESNIKSVL